MSLATRFSPVLVTGGSGFIGACAVRRLLEEGFAVHVLLRPEARRWRLADVLEAVTVHDADVLDDGAVREAFQACRPRAVLHLAAHGAYESQSDARRILRTTVLGTLNVLEAAAACGARVVVNAGSSSEYGYKAGPMSESDRLEPNSIYAVGKAAQTHLVGVLARRSAAPAMATFRVFSIYGPWEEPTRLFPTLLRRARAGQPLEMVARGTARDFVYVDDVVDALVRLDALEGLRGDVLNLGSGVQSTLEDVVAAVQAAVGSRSEVLWGAMAARQWDTDCWRADPSRAREVLGWTARTSLRDGVARMARWMEEAPAADAGD
jgi:nucleoside-diphosphate-sugar epimerase